MYSFYKAVAQFDGTGQLILTCHNSEVQFSVYLATRNQENKIIQHLITVPTNTAVIDKVNITFTFFKNMKNT